MATRVRRIRKTAKRTSGTPKPKPINWRALGKILNTAVRYPRFRNKLLASPKETLAAHNYEVHPAAEKFFKSLSRAHFGRAGKRFEPSDPHAPWFGEAI